MIILTDGYKGETAYPENHARIGYQNFGPLSVWTSSGSAAGYPLSALTNEMTLRRWKADANTSWLEITMNREINYIAFAAHNLNGKTVTVTNISDEIHEFAPTDDEAIMVCFDAQTVETLRIDITGTEPAEIGVLYIGNVLEMQRPFYGGHSPGNLSRVTVQKPRLSDSGQFLSKTTIKQGYETKVDWKYLTAAWYRTYFDPFVESISDRPFFIAWNPSGFPNETLFGWTDKDIRPTNMGKRDLMQVGFAMRCYGPAD